MQTMKMDATKLLSATALAFVLMAGAAAAQTTGTTTGTDTTGTYTGTSATDTSTGADSSSTVGTPNTGAGGSAAANGIVLGTAALLALGGAAYLAKKPAL